MYALGLLALVLLLLFLRQPIFVVVGTGVIYCYEVWGDGQPALIVSDIWDSINRTQFLAIPLFILAGNIMARGAIAERIVGFVRSLTRPIPGGLGVATVVSCGFFAAISGSGVVTMLAVGSIMYPALKSAGYPKSYAVGILGAAGTLGVILPPSIQLILFGIMTETSIADLFKAGVGPGLLLASIFAAYTIIRFWGRPRERLSITEVLGTAKRGILSLAMPGIILGGIYSGHFTAVEAGAIAIVYAIAIELPIHREMKPEDLIHVAVDTGKLLGGLFVVVSMAVSLNVFLTYEKVPAQAVALLTGAIHEPWQFLLMANLMLLLIGALMDEGSAILIFAPLLTPIAVSFGIDPIHWGIIMILNLQIGYIHPPVGLNIIVAMSAFKESYWFITKALLPYIAMMLVALLAVILVPEISGAFLDRPLKTHVHSVK